MILALATALAAALIGGYIARALRVPVILGYIVAGVVLAPSTPGPVADLDTVRTLAELGVAFLMFSLGVEFSLGELRAVQRIAIGGGALQVLLSIVFGAALATGVGMPWRSAVVFGMIVALSSSIVALKLLQLRGETSTLHGHVTIGLAIFQDLSLVPMLLVLPLLADSGHFSALGLARTAGIAIATLAAVIVLGTRLVPAVLGRVASTFSRELFLLAVISIALGTALVTEEAGLSLALGAFLAGIVVSESDFNYQVLADVIPLRDVFATLFFVSIGMLLDTDYLRARIALVVAVVALIVLGKFVIMAAIARGFGSPAGTAVLVGLLLAQIGELSFILASEAVDRGVLTSQDYGLVVAATGGTILVVSLAFGARTRLVTLAERAPLFGGGQASLEAIEVPLMSYHCVICGYGRLARELVETLERRGLPYVIIDADPAAVRRALAAGAPALYGDAGNPEVLRRAGIARARTLVVAISDPLAAEAAVRFGVALGTRLRVVARAVSREQMPRLRDLGATEVIQPEFEAGLEVIRHVLHVYGVDQRQIEAIVQRRRGAYYEAAPERA